MLFSRISYLDQDFTIRENCDLRVKGQIISEISSRELTPLAGEQVISGKDKLIMPGFFNAHCHLPMTLLRGHGENLSLQAWLTEKIFPFEKLLTQEDIYIGSLLGLAELLASGCCGISDMYFGLPAIIRAVQETGFKANLVNPLGGPGTYSQMSDFQDVLDLARLAQADPDRKLRIDAGVHAEYTTTPRGVQSVVEFAQARGLTIHLHLSESRAEHEACKAKYGKTPLSYFYDLGLFTCPVMAAHAVHLEDSDYALLKDLVQQGHQISLVHNPSSNLKLASGFAPLKKWVESGVNICLGTDGAASNNNLNLFEELHLAAILQKAIQNDPTFLTPQDLLKMATRNGAIAQGRLDSGLIKVGYKADLLVLDLDKPHFYPRQNLISHLCYSAQAADVLMTIVDGRLLYTHGQFMTIDIAQVQAAAQAIYAEKIKLIR